MLRKVTKEKNTNRVLAAQFGHKNYLRLLSGLLDNLLLFGTAGVFVIKRCVWFCAKNNITGAFWFDLIDRLDQIGWCVCKIVVRVVRVVVVVKLFVIDFERNETTTLAVD